MLAQIPLIWLTGMKYFKDSQWGNVIVWLSLIFGQPNLMLQYARDYLQNHPELLE